MHDPYEPPRNYPKEITIREVGNGFIVTVGCQTVVFDHIDELTEAVEYYYKYPDRAEEEYITSSQHSRNADSE